MPLIVCGFFSVAFVFVKDPEEGHLPLLISASSLPEILEECVYVNDAFRGQHLECLCWYSRLTRGFVIGKFGDGLLDFTDGRTVTQAGEGASLGDVIQHSEVNRCIIVIVYFVAM